MKVAISIADVKKLRDETLAGMMHCKKALERSNGDLDAAKEYLKIQGLLIAEKKSSRDVSDGLIGSCVASDFSYGFVMELNSETDFVAKNDKFQELFNKILHVALEDKICSIDDLKKKNISGHSIESEIANNIAILGENILLGKFFGISSENGVIASYVHGMFAPNVGKMAALVHLESSGNKSKLKEIGEKIAMHVVANKPLSVSISDLPGEVVSKEKGLIAEQVSRTGKTQEIVERIIEGKMRKYYSEVVLLHQPFVMDTNVTINQFLEQCAEDLSAEIKLVDYKLLILGDK